MWKYAIDNITGQEYENYGADEWRKPEIEKDEEFLISEHGRVINNVCYRSHWLGIIKQKYEQYYLIVKHGGGQEKIYLNYKGKYIVKILEKLTSDERYLMMYEMLDIKNRAEQIKCEEVSKKYETAFIEGRLKKRKHRNSNFISVYIK